MLFPTFSTTQQKIAALWLLSGSCLVSVLILFLSPSENYVQLTELTQADSLIQQELALFNISSEHIQIQTFPVTDKFTRKSYEIDLPVQVSMTHFHAELEYRLQLLGISTIGFVNVPDREMKLHLFYNDKIIRTIELRTDPDYIRIPHPASLLIYFDRSPTESQLESIRKLDIPVNIVFRSESRRSLVQWAEMLPDDMNVAAIWFGNERTGYEMAGYDDTTLFQTLEEILQIRKKPLLLDFSMGGPALTSGQLERLKSMNITIIEAGDMTILSTEDRFEFDRKMLTYSRLARQAGEPEILVRGTNRTIEWLMEWIPRIQRGGVKFVSL